MPLDTQNLAIPSFITVGNTTYLGKLERSPEAVTITNGLILSNPSEITEETIKEYMVAAYSDKLTSTIVSNASDWSETQLDEDLQTTWEICKLNMKMAIKKAPIEAVVAVFKAK